MLQQQENDPRVVRTRNLIREAALTLAKEKSFDSVTVKDISEKATINRATFYAHYIDKFDLLEEMISIGFDDLITNKIDLNQPLTREMLLKLIDLITIYHEIFYKQCRIDSKSISALVESTVQQRLREILIQMLKKRTDLESQPETKIELLATMVSSSIYTTTKHYFTAKEAKKPTLFVEEIITFVMTGIKAVLVS